MYQRFKDCLLKPRNIADYIKEPKKKTVIYTIVLLIVYLIPLILISILSTSSLTTLSSSVAEDLIEAEQINYEIKDGKLVSTIDNALPQVIETKILLLDNYELKALYVFDEKGNDFEEILDVESGSYVVLLFSETKFTISTINVSDSQNNNNEENKNPGITLSTENNDSTNENDLELLSFTYEELAVSNVNFAGNKDNNTIDFKNNIATIVSAIYNKIKMRYLPLIILVVMLMGISSYFFSVIFITLLFKLFYRYLNVSFGVVFKTTILCSTPYVICSLLATLTGLTLLDIVGQFIMIAYATRALTTYKIKYDGGVPLPKYMQNMMGKKDDEEKGSDDDEL